MKLGTGAYFELRTCAFKFAYCSSCLSKTSDCDVTDPSMSILILNLYFFFFSINYTQ